MNILRRIGHRLSDRVGRNALEQLRFKLQRDLREMEALKQQYPNLLAPGLFFAWQRHERLKAACEGYAAEIARIIGQTPAQVLSETKQTMGIYWGDDRDQAVDDGETLLPGITMDELVALAKAIDFPADDLNEIARSIQQARQTPQ